MLAHGILGGADITGNEPLYEDTMGLVGRSTLPCMMTVDAQIRFDHHVQRPDLRHQLGASAQATKIFVKAAMVLEPFISVEPFTDFHPLQQETKVRDDGAIHPGHREADRQPFEDRADFKNFEVSSSVSPETTQPRFGRIVTRPSAANRRNASRTGMRLIPISVAISSGIKR